MAAEHVRTQIRKAITAALTGLTTAGDRVFESYPHPLQDKDLPGLKVDTVDPGEVESDDLHDLLRRRLPVRITACVKQNAGYQDVVDQMFLEVEKALAADQTLGGLIHSLRPVSEPGYETEAGERTVQRAGQIFEVEYFTAFSAPDVAL